jgi:hypothetical protein
MPRLTKDDKLLFQEFAAEFRSCAICWWPESDMRRRMEIHHICGGSARTHDRRNLLTTCSRCHGVYHNGKIDGNFPDITKAMILTAKKECDPDHYDPEYLAWLRHRKHLGYDPQPIDPYYLEERERNVGSCRKP